MKQVVRTLTIAFCVAAFAGPANAGSIVFTFTEGGGTVTMTPSGTLDTTQLVASALPFSWVGTGTEDNFTPGDIDVMGSDEPFFDDIDAQFGFNAGTDASAITNPGGPFAFPDFSAIITSGGRIFATYSGQSGGLRQPGISVLAADIVGGLWTPDITWTYAPGATFASLGLIPGTYSVSDSLTRETITIQIGGAAVPEPTSLLLVGTGLAGLLLNVRRRRRLNQ